VKTPSFGGQKVLSGHNNEAAAHPVDICTKSDDNVSKQTPLHSVAFLRLVARHGSHTRESQSSFPGEFEYPLFSLIDRANIPISEIAAMASIETNSRKKAI
jgi:hypothetical protein